VREEEAALAGRARASIGACGGRPAKAAPAFAAGPATAPIRSGRGEKLLARGGKVPAGGKKTGELNANDDSVRCDEIALFDTPKKLILWRQQEVDGFITHHR